MHPSLAELLELSAARHSHLCPRQVLGVRMGLAAMDILGVETPVTKQTALVILETDGCFADGIQVATGATIGHRSLRVNDLGKIAASFVSVTSGRAIRLSPAADSRLRGPLYAPEQDSRYMAQLQGYQVMPAEQLFQVQDIILDPPLEAILSRPDARVVCQKCGEEIINEREAALGGAILCRSCAEGSYYRLQSGNGSARSAAARASGRNQE